MKKVAYIGLDVHKNSVALEAVIGSGNTGSVSMALPNEPDRLLKELRKLKRKYEPRVVYEAGGCGFVLYRCLRKAGIECMVAAPSLIPVNTKRVKTDKRDARKLAEYLRAGLLTPVTVLDEELEQVREIVRFRETLVGHRKKTKQQILALLLRKGIKYETGKEFSRKFLDWLRGVELEGYNRYLLEQQIIMFESLQNMIHAQEAMLEEIARSENWQAKVRYLRAFRGIDLITAMTILTHVPDFRAFDSPRKLFSFAGLVPSEHSSGDSAKRGPITKQGNRQLRKALVLAAGQYNLARFRESKGIGERRANVPAHIATLARSAESRLRKRFLKLISEGKHVNKAKTAVARELLGFVWEVMMHLHRGELNSTA